MSREPHPNPVRAHLAGQYDQPRGRCATEDQDRVFNSLKDGYDAITIVPLAGEDNRWRAHCLHSSGQVMRYVEVAADGEVLRDDKPTLAVYQPQWDVLLVRQGKDDWTFVAPPGSGLLPIAFVPHDEALDLAESVRGWAWRRSGSDETSVWELRDGKLIGPYRREPDGWEHA